MNKFLLINSPIFWDTTNEDENYLSPLGLAYIATYLERSEFEVTIKDCVKDRISVSNLLEIFPVQPYKQYNYTTRNCLVR